MDGENDKKIKMNKTNNQIEETFEKLDFSIYMCLYWLIGAIVQTIKLKL